MKKSKIASLALAGALTVTALLAGTYAWTSISQQATNEVTGEVNPGGRLHDDFNGENKDIYVENFTGRTEGEEGAIIYARIKLDEYLSIGAGAGTVEGDDNQIGGKDGETTIENTDTWTTFKLEDESNSIFRNYFEWEWGGTTIYMPTFNKNKDSLEADINGTLAGTEEGPYKDYVLHANDQTKTDLEIYDADTDTTNEDAVNEGVYLNDAIIAALGNGQGGIVTTLNDGSSTPVAVGASITLTVDNNGTPATVTAKVTEVEKATDGTTITAVYLDLDDDNIADEDKKDGADIKVVASQTHTADTTLDATVITMAQWKANGYTQGEFWVYDTDGWAYWADGIAPGKATGCLLTAIERKGSIVDKYYYAINVTAQFATAGDWGKADDTGTTDTNEATGFYIDGITEDGLYLLNTIAGEEKNILIGVAEGESYDAAVGVKPGETLQLEADVMLGAQELNDSVTWSLEEGTYTPGVTTIDPATGELTIGTDETKEFITVTAALTRTPNVTATKTINVGQYYTVAVATANNAENLLVPENIKTLTLEAAVTNQRGEAETSGVTWSLVDKDSYAAGTSIEQSTGILTIADDETATEIKVVATSVKDESASSQPFTVNVDSQLEYVAAQVIDTSEEATTRPIVKIDGVDWYVLLKQEADAENETPAKALLWSVKGVEGWGGPGKITGWAYWSEDFPLVSADVQEQIDGGTAVTQAQRNWWKFSNARAWLNSTEKKTVETTEEETGITTTTVYDGFLADKEILSANAITTDIYTKHEYNQTGDDENYELTQDKVFILTQADLYGHAPGTDDTGKYEANGTAVAKDYTVADVRLVSDNLAAELRLPKNGWYFLRSPREYEGLVSSIYSDGILSYGSYKFTDGRLRPALWINLSSSEN